MTKSEDSQIVNAIWNAFTSHSSDDAISPDTNVCVELGHIADAMKERGDDINVADAISELAKATNNCADELRGLDNIATAINRLADVIEEKGK